MWLPAKNTELRNDILFSNWLSCWFLREKHSFPPPTLVGIHGYPSAIIAQSPGLSLVSQDLGCVLDGRFSVLRVFHKCAVANPQMRLCHTQASSAAENGAASTCIAVRLRRNCRTLICGRNSDPWYPSDHLVLSCLPGFTSFCVCRLFLPGSRPSVCLRKWHALEEVCLDCKRFLPSCIVIRHKTQPTY